MDPLTLSLLAYGGYSWWSERKKKLAAAGKDPNKLDDFVLPTISPAVASTFTSFVEGARQFDRVSADGLPVLLEARSAVPISPGPFADLGPSVRVYRILPLQAGCKNAGEVLAAARAENQTVLASLSTQWLALGSHDPMLLVTGGTELRHQALIGPGPTPHFALLPPPVAKAAAVVTPAPDKEKEEAKFPSTGRPEDWAEIANGKETKAKANGASKKVEHPIVIEAPAEIVEPSS